MWVPTLSQTRGTIGILNLPAMKIHISSFRLIESKDLLVANQVTIDADGYVEVGDPVFLDYVGATKEAWDNYHKKGA